MSTKQNIAHTNRQVRENLAKGRGRLAGVIELDKAARKAIEQKCTGKK